MKAVVQRVLRASVTIDGAVTAEIGSGVVIFAGVFEDDNERDAIWLGEKCAALRIFEDENGKMGIGLEAAGNRALVVSNFTLCGSVKKGRRPDFARSAPPERARELMTVFTDAIRSAGVTVMEGVFAAEMKVALVNDGPVTIIADSRE